MPVSRPLVRADTRAIMGVPAKGEHAARIESMLRRNDLDLYPPVVSQAVLGEAAAVIPRRGPDAARMLDAMSALLADSGAGPDSCMPPPGASALAIVD